MHDTEIWNQRWFRRMSGGNKLAYFYIKDRCNHAGIWTMDIIQLCEDLRSTKFELDSFILEANRDFNPITGEEQKRIRFKIVNERYLWMVDYITFHWGNKDGVTCSPKYNPVVTAMEYLKGLGTLDEALEKGWLTLSEPLPKGTSKSKSNSSSNSNNYKKEEKKNSKFKKPTVEECSKWLIDEKGLDPTEAHLVAKEFHSFYEMGNWMISGGKKMQKWKIALGRAMNWKSIKKILNKEIYEQGNFDSGSARTRISDSEAYLSATE